MRAVMFSAGLILAAQSVEVWGQTQPADPQVVLTTGCVYVPGSSDLGNEWILVDTPGAATARCAPTIYGVPARAPAQPDVSQDVATPAVASAPARLPETAAGDTVSRAVPAPGYLDPTVVPPRKIRQRWPGFLVGVFR